MKNKSAAEKMAEAWGKVAELQEQPHQEPKQQIEETSLINNVTFSFLLQMQVVEQLREIEAIKRKDDFHYCVSDVIRDGIEIMRNKYKDLPLRPNGVIPTRRGKRSNSTKTERVFTSCRISAADREFIYDFMYSKNINIDGDFLSTNYTKDDFIEQLLKDFKGSLKYKHHCKNK